VWEWNVFQPKEVVLQHPQISGISSPACAHDTVWPSYSNQVFHDDQTKMTRVFTQARPRPQPGQFLPSDAMRNAVFAVSRCLAVRPSVCHVGALYPDGWRYRQTSLRPGSPIILVFWPQRRYPIPRNPFSGGGGARYNGWENIFDFRQKSPSIPETVRDRPMVAMER